MSESRQLLTKLIHAEAENPKHSVAAIAERIRTQHPELVQEWGEEHLPMLFTGWVSDVLRWARRDERKRSPMEEIVERAESGLSLFDLSYVVNDDNLRKPLGEMIGSDHFYVAEAYRQESRRASAYAELHDQIGRAVGRKLTRTVYSETDLRQLFVDAEGRK